MRGMDLTEMKGPVLRPGDAGYDDERTGFQALAAHRPDVVAGVVDADDVRLAVAYAVAEGLPVGVQATGHGLPVPAEGGLLVSTRRMTGVRVDPDTATARVEAGVRWSAVIQRAARYGLAPLSGSAPSVGAVSYSLGGGVGLLARSHGYAADQVRAVEVVTADAELRRVTPDSDPDLFWALVGGRGNFGVVTALEIGLVPVTNLYGGALFLDADRVDGVLGAWREWTDTVPEEMTSSVALIPFPDAPQVPEVLRGRRVAHVRIAYPGPVEVGEPLVARLRALGPALKDTVRVMPYAESGSIHDDPAGPLAFYATHTLLGDLPPAAAGALEEAAAGHVVEVRHLGGALSRPGPAANAVGNRDAAFHAGLLSRLDAGADPAPVRPAHERVRAALAPWSTGGRALTFLYGEHANPDEVRRAYAPDVHRRLAALKAEWDPANLFRLNHNIPPAR
ncbi:FAD-binding oxidoreductase [Nonomuraea rhodomycinica]|uniref:FAD-binding oxidoreductase n=2 Tax=Nonomuraea rhodomycinica TaxID=1712872 RepID=A0A7Y6IX33_9ACTN|nr:FAD-binding oxidoreductase [Nonomuraea rhodomycinica]